MHKIGLAFLFVAALNALVGVSLGIAMGITHDFTLSPVHAHLNLLGWVSLALFGLTYQCWLDIGRTRLARYHLMIAAPSSALFPLGIYFAIVHESPALAIVASLAWLTGVLMFALGIGRMLFRPAPDHAPSGVDRVTRPAR